MPSAPNSRQLTNTEIRLAEQYVSVLDFVSRCAQAVEEGNWYYLLDKSRPTRPPEQAGARAPTPCTLRSGLAATPVLAGCCNPLSRPVRGVGADVA